MTYVSSGAGARHSSAEEAVDEQHHHEQHTERDGEVKQPQRTHAAVSAW